MTTTGPLPTHLIGADDPLALARTFCLRVPHSRDLGMKIIPTDGSRACMCLTSRPSLLEDSDVPTLCSSVLYSLADSAAGLAVFAATRKLDPIATLDLRMNYLRAAPADIAIEASAECEALTEDVAFVRCLVRAQDTRDVLATGDATFMRGTRGHRFDADPASESPTAGQPDAVLKELEVGAPARSYPEHLGLEMLAGEDGVQLHLPYREHLIGNYMIPALHGGVMGGLIQEGARLAVCARLGGRTLLRILNCNIDYHRPAKPMATYASVEIGRHSRRTMLAQVVCWQSRDRSPVASGRVQILLEAAAPGIEQAAAGASS